MISNNCNFEIESERSSIDFMATPSRLDTGNLDQTQ